MATVGSKLITKEMQWNANMTDQNHLGAALIAKPHQLMGTMDRLFSAENYYSDNPLTSVLVGNKLTEEEIGGTEWTWQIQGANTRPLVVVENVEGDHPVGKYNQSFRLKLDENWFLPGDNIFPGTSDKQYLVRIMDEAQRSGDGWIYRVQIVGEDPNVFIPKKYLQPGTQWTKLFSTYEEAAEQSGSTLLGTPMSLKNSVTKLRKQYRITDYASTEVLAVAIPDAKGKMHNSWIRYAEVEYWRQWYREIERAIWYGRKSTKLMGSTGYSVMSGPGIQQQLEDSHVHRYTHLTARLLEEYLMDIFYGRVKPGKGRHVKGYTGEYGMLAFNRAMQEWMGRNNFVIDADPVVIKKTRSELHNNAYEAGYQVVRYNMANGCSLELVCNPLYDDRDINYEIDPITNFPLESQRITFLDFSGDSGKTSNIKLVKKKDGEAFGYVEGLYGPYGPSKGGKSAHSGSYYEMHVEKTFGIQITDITKCGELILSRN